MDKTYKCDRCRCQDICKLENVFRNTQDKLDEIISNGNGYFSIEFVCGRFIPVLSILHLLTVRLRQSMCFENHNCEEE